MKRTILRLTLGLLLLGTPVYGGDVLEISGLPNYPPVLWEADGTLMGVGAELAKRICTELKVSCRLKPVPYNILEKVPIQASVAPG